MKDTKLYVLVVTLSAIENRKLSKRLSNGSERLVDSNRQKTKCKNKNTKEECRYFLESYFIGVNRLFVLTYTNQDNNTKQYKDSRYYLPKGIFQNYNFIIIGKNFYDQSINFVVKWYKDIRKLTSQRENYTTGCLLGYDYTKYQNKLIAVDLSR